MDSSLALKLLPSSCLHPLCDGYLPRSLPGDAAERQPVPPQDNDCARWGSENNIALDSIQEGLRISFMRGFVSNLSQHPESGWFTRGWDIAKRELLIIQKECAQRGITFIVCFLPSKEHVYLPRIRASRGDRCYREYLAALLPHLKDIIADSLDRNMHAQQETLRSFCAQEKIPFMDLYPLLASESAFPPLLYYCDDPHFNSHGVEVVARGICQWMAGTMPELLGPRKEK